MIALSFLDQSPAVAGVTWRCVSRKLYMRSAPTRSS